MSTLAYTCDLNFYLRFLYKTYFLLINSLIHEVLSDKHFYRGIDKDGISGYSLDTLQSFWPHSQKSCKFRLVGIYWMALRFNKSLVQKYLCSNLSIVNCVIQAWGFRTYDYYFLVENGLIYLQSAMLSSLSLAVGRLSASGSVWFCYFCSWVNYCPEQSLQKTNSCYCN